MDSSTSTPELTSAPTLLFRVGTTVYGCDITQAQEIVPLRSTTRLPGAPPYVRGLINMRGIIVTVLDLGARLDPSGQATRDGSILLVRHRERLVGVIVEEVVDVRVLDVEADESARAGASASIVRGMATLDDAPVVVLDLDALFKQVLLS